MSQDHELVNPTPKFLVEIALGNDEHSMKSVFKCDASPSEGHLQLEHDFVSFVSNEERKVQIYVNGKSKFHKPAKFLSEIGGERIAPWIRVRKIIFA